MNSLYPVRTITFSAHNELYIIDCNNVLYMEADDHYTQVYYQLGTKFLVPFGLAEINNKILDGFMGEFLFRVGRSYIINVRSVFHINIIKNEIFLADAIGKHHSLHISKQALRELMGKLDSCKQ